MSVTNEYTYNPEKDFIDNPFILYLFNLFKSSIVYHLYLERYFKDHPCDSPFGNVTLSLAQRVYDNPRLFETIVCNSKVQPDGIFQAINDEEFNGEHVLFNDIDKLKESSFFNDICFVIDYIEHMPTLDIMIDETDRKAKMYLDRRKNENVMLINKELIY